VRVGHPPDQVEEGEHHSQADPAEHAEGEHPEGGDQAQHQLAPPEAGDPPPLGHVDETVGGVDDDAAERRRREGREDRAEEQESGHHARERDERVELGAAAHHVAQCGAASAAAHREPLEQGGADVHEAEREQLLAAVDLLAVARREGP